MRDDLVAQMRNGLRYLVHVGILGHKRLPSNELHEHPDLSSKQSHILEMMTYWPETSTLMRLLDKVSSLSTSNCFSLLVAVSAFLAVRRGLRRVLPSPEYHQSRTIGRLREAQKISITPTTAFYEESFWNWPA
jgi:hypothetical protein